MRLFIFICTALTFSFANVSDDYLAQLEQKIENFKSFDAKRGETIFTSTHMGKKGKVISCTSCHGTNLNESHKNFFTGKVIEPLSPKANPQRLTKIKNIEKWLMRNFKDVYNREGTPQEKGDVITYILSKE